MEERWRRLTETRNLFKAATAHLVPEQASIDVKESKLAWSGEQGSVEGFDDRGSAISSPFSRRLLAEADAWGNAAFSPKSVMIPKSVSPPALRALWISCEGHTASAGHNSTCEVSE